MMDNYAIADQFSLLAKLMDIHGDNPFKSKSYASAAFNIEKLPVQLSDTPAEKIASLKGIGDSSAKKIVEMLETGRLQQLDDLIAKTPAGILEMMQIKGLGPKKISTIWKEMGIENMGELLYACGENRLLLYKGFGEKTQESVRQSINFFMHNKGHFLYAEIEEFAFKAETIFQEQFPKYRSCLTGEIGRQLNIITKLEILTTAPKNEVHDLLERQEFQNIVAEDSTITATTSGGIQIAIQLCSEDNFIARKFSGTCSELFLEIFKKSTGFSEDKNYASEEEIFQQSKLHFIAPNRREDPEIISAALMGPLEPVIEPGDIKGIIHSHSNWSDGLHTIEIMARACIEKGYEYLVISDHSRSAFYANGLSAERIVEQHLYIDELNSKLTPFRIFKSIECDILTDGSLDYSDDILNSFDLVIASVHSNLKMTEEKAMQRLLKAITHPAVTILGHMTGRLLLSRPGYPLDHKMIIDACAAHKVVIEINAHPRRLDLDWSWIPYAMEKGCLLSIDPDAHAVEGYEDCRYGVISAQKGGLTKASNLSSFTRAELENYLTERRSAVRN